VSLSVAGSPLQHQGTFFVVLISPNSAPRLGLARKRSLFQAEVLSSPPPSIVRSSRIVVYFLDLVWASILLGVTQSLVRTMGDFCGF
jgi:hypothetical protein